MIHVGRGLIVVSLLLDVSVSPAQAERGVAEMDARGLFAEGVAKTNLEASLQRFVHRNEPVVLRAALALSDLSIWDSDQDLLRLSTSCGDGDMKAEQVASLDVDTCAETPAKPSCGCTKKEDDVVVGVRAVTQSRTTGNSEGSGKSPARFGRQRKTLGYEKENITLANFIQRYQDPHDESVLYLAQLDVEKRLPGLVAALPPYPLHTLNNSGVGKARSFAAVTIYWGAKASVTQLHYDSNDNIVCVVAGGWKTFRLIDPFTSAALLYSDSKRDGNTSPVPIDLPVAQWADDYPLAVYALPVLVTLQPTDCLFLPIYWYHQVESAPSRTISINWWREVDKSRKDIVGKLLCGHSNRKARKTCH